MILTRKEKEDLVIKLAEEGKSTRQIAEAAHISLKDISTILRRYTGEEETAAEKSMSINSKAFKLFKENKDLVDVAIILDVEADEILGMYSDYLRLSKLDKLMSIYRETGDEIHLILWLYNNLKWHGLANENDISNIIHQGEQLKHLDKVIFERAEEIGRLNSLKMRLEKGVDDLMKRIDHYDSVLSDISK